MSKILKPASYNTPLMLGHAVERGKQLLADSGIEITSADSLADAAKKIVEIVAAN